MGKKRVKSTAGVSRSVNISIGSTSRSRHALRTASLQTKSVGMAGMEQVRQEADQRLQQALAGLSDETLRMLADMKGEEFQEDTVVQDGDVDMADDSGWQTLPTEQEASEDFILTVRDALDSPWGIRQRKDERTQQDRRRGLDANWAPLLPALSSAYIRWRYKPETIQPTETDQPTEEYSFTIDIIDLYSLSPEAHITPIGGAKSGAEALILHGFLGITPVHSSLAISLKALKLFRRLRLRKASLSVEAFAKVLCDYYEVPYRRTYRCALADAFDVYLTILQSVENQVLAALGRDSPNWRVMNACPPCGYQLEGEPEMRFSRLYCFDGNNSLRRMASLAGRETVDVRVFDGSNYYLSDHFVNKFAHEVKGRKAASGDVEGSPDEGGGAPSLEPDEGDPTDGSSSTSIISGCVQHWKAAAADDAKRMWAVFAETGLFGSVCRHAFILWIIDMVRSGELAKYPLAIIAKVMEVFGSNTCGGYDIGCSFLSTVLSSCLGPEFQRLNSTLCVNAFHGYSHNYACQSVHHPNVIEGIGLEDLETCERVFSASNQLVSVTRYASAYRRRVFIHMFFQQWDEDKYANLGNFLYNNYTQALQILDADTFAMNEAIRAFGFEKQDLEKWEIKETQCLAMVGQEPEWDMHAVAYVSQLQELRSITAKYETSSTHFLNATPEDYAFVPPGRSRSQPYYAADVAATAKLETERRHLIERLSIVSRSVIEMEVRMGITQRWTLLDPQYMETLKYTRQREYHLALDKLQKLVVQRLFELHKMNLAQTGYRMCTHIAKSLQTHCKAIQNGVKQYNTAAAALDPPRPALDWSRVSNYAFLEEFTLLRETRQDIRDKPWTQPAIRETMRQHRRIKRAKEEIQRCNVEIHRLHTSIVDEDRFMSELTQRLQDRGDPIHDAVDEYCRRRRRVNASILARLFQLHQLPGFTGEKTPGRRLGSQAEPPHQSPASEVPTGSPALECPAEAPAATTDMSGELAMLNAEDAVADGLEDDEYAQTTLGGLVDYISRLAL